MPRLARHVLFLVGTSTCLIVCAWFAFAIHTSKHIDGIDPTRVGDGNDGEPREQLRLRPSQTQRLESAAELTTPTSSRPRVENLHVRFRRGSEPVRARAWSLDGRTNQDQEVHREGFSSEEGLAHLALEAGNYTLRLPALAVWNAPPTRRITFGPHRPQAIAERSLDIVILEAEAEQWVEVALAPGSLHVRAVDTTTLRPIPHAHFAVRNTRGTTAELVGDEEGRVVLEEVEPGVWSVQAHAAHHRQVDPTTFEISDLTPEHRADILLQPTATLIVRLLGADGEALEISHALRMDVRSSDGSAHVPSGSTTREGRNRPHELIYAHLPSERYQIQIQEEERELDDEWCVRFQPVDCATPYSIYAAAGKDTRADLQVRYRAYVRLKCAHPGLASLTVRPLQGDPKLRRALPGPWQHGATSGDWQFDGYLAPGTYDVVLTHRDGRQWVERLAVERTPIDRIFAPTWEGD